MILALPTLSRYAACDRRSGAIQGAISPLRSSGGDVACVQLRLKSHARAWRQADDEILRAAETLLPIARAPRRCFSHQRPAGPRQKASGADGVHVGQSGRGLRGGACGRLLGPEAIVGVTCHNSKPPGASRRGRRARTMWRSARSLQTDTKDGVRRAQSRRTAVEWWSARDNRCRAVAIGGITAENCAPLVAAGADFLAVSGAVWNDPPTARALQSRRLMRLLRMPASAPSLDGAGEPGDLS